MPATQVASDPFEAMGRPISSDGRQAAVVLLLDLGRSFENAVSSSDQVAKALERNEPELAFSVCRTFLGDDVTLHYRLVALLLTHANMAASQTRGGSDIAASVGQEG
jgi:hypothetical protein